MSKITIKKQQPLQIRKPMIIYQFRFCTCTVFLIFAGLLFLMVIFLLFLFGFCFQWCFHHITPENVCFLNTLKSFLVCCPIFYEILSQDECCVFVFLYNSGFDTTLYLTFVQPCFSIMICAYFNALQLYNYSIDQ